CGSGCCGGRTGRYGRAYWFPGCASQLPDPLTREPLEQPMRDLTEVLFEVLSVPAVLDALPEERLPINLSLCHWDRRVPTRLFLGRKVEVARQRRRLPGHLLVVRLGHHGPASVLKHLLDGNAWLLHGVCQGFSVWTVVTASISRHDAWCRGIGNQTAVGSIHAGQATGRGTETTGVRVVAAGV